MSNYTYIIKCADDTLYCGWTNDLELYDIIIEIAEDLYNDCQMSEYSDYTDEIWESKYVKLTYITKAETGDSNGYK